MATIDLSRLNAGQRSVVERLDEPQLITRLRARADRA